MALNTGTNTTTQQQFTAAAQQKTQRAPATPVSFGITSRLGNTGAGGEQYDKIFEYLTTQSIKIANESARDGEKYNVVRLMKDVWGLNYSGIVVTESKDNFVAAHVLIVEKTGAYPEKLIETVGNIRYEILRTPADALDSKCVSAAQTLVAEFLKVDINNVSIVDGTLIPAEFDATSESLLLSLANNTLNATHAEIEMRVNGYRGLNLGEFNKANPNGKFVVDVYYNGDDTTVFDQTGMPIRQDICIVVSHKSAGVNNRQSVNQAGEKVEVVKTYGYIDFEFVGSTVVNGMMSTQKFTPNFIITHLESPYAPTPDIVMLGVASAVVMNEDLNWLQAFRPSTSKKTEIDYNDIGALNIEGNIDQKPTGFSTRVNIKSKDFSLMELNKLATMLVNRDLLVSIDLPKAGPETWYTSVFHYIRFQNSQPAYDRLVHSIETQTNGVFANNNLPVFYGTTNKIHGGYYRAKDGARDLRQLSSYLAMANHVTDTNQNPVLLQQYTNTMYGNIQTELRAAERKKYIDDMSKNTAVVKQMYDRVTFNRHFLASYVNALKQAGFNPVFGNMGAGNDMFMSRSTADFSGAALGSDVRLMNAGTAGPSMFFNPVYMRGF